MTESLKKMVNQSMTHFPKTRIVQSISQLGTQVFNKSFEINSQSEDSLNNEELLRMEIKQLKRENAFLKGKIQELKKTQPITKPQHLKRQSINCMNILKKRTESKVLGKESCSVSFVLREVQSILKSLAALHKIEIDEKAWVMEDLSQLKQEIEQKSMARIDKEYRQRMHKKLQMIPLAREETRYGSLLQIFSEYYQLKSQEQRKMKDKIEKYIEKTIDISRNLIENANNKALERSMRASSIYSTSGNILNSDTSISLNHTLSTNGISILYQKPKFGYNPEKHELSYSTIDAQYVLPRDAID